MQHLIKYRGYHSGPKDTGGMTALHDTEAEALDRANACKYRDETAWVRAEFAGPMDTVLIAQQQLMYVDWKNGVTAKTIQPGGNFRAGDVMVADHHVTPGTIAQWLLSGKVTLKVGRTA